MKQGSLLINLISEPLELFIEVILSISLDFFFYNNYLELTDQYPGKNLFLFIN